MILSGLFFTTVTYTLLLIVLLAVIVVCQINILKEQTGTPACTRRTFAHAEAVTHGTRQPAAPVQMGARIKLLCRRKHEHSMTLYSEHWLYNIL